MCGILGMTPPGDPDAFEAALMRLFHRGPDDGGTYRDGGIMLGHRRLSILDVTRAGRQPMSYADGRYWIVYNGEVYNFVELRGELEGLGHRFRSETDTEVVLAAYVQWGPECFLRFNGMWALAIWDARDRKLILSRDRLGKKPLFYANVGGRFVFASEMKAIMPFLPAVEADVELVRAAERNAFGYEATDRCLIRGIRRFPAGHYGVLGADGSLRLTRYWNTLDHRIFVPARYEEQVEQFRELFLDACRLRMRSDVAIGTALSGGLDSSATLAMMAKVGRLQPAARVSDDWQHAFVACFPGTPLDESEYASAVVDHLGIKATFIEIDPLACIDRLHEYLFLTEELYFTSPIPFVLTYAAVRENGIRVTIDGHGADELFAGYPGTVIRALDDAGWHFGRARDVLATYNDLFPEGRPPGRSTGLGPAYWARRRAAWAVATPRRIWADARDRRGLDHLTRKLDEVTHRTVLPTLLRNYDRYSMANGVEIRMPFLDHRILSFAFSLPWTSKVGGGYSKRIVRDGVAPLLPSEVVFRKRKIGFNSPTTDWIKGPLRPYIQDVLRDRRFRESPLVDAKKADRLVRKVIEDPNATFVDGSEAWESLVPYLWERAMLAPSPAPTAAEMRSTVAE